VQNAHPDSEFLKQLGRVGTDAEQLLDTLNLVDMIDGSEDGLIDYENFVREIFRLNKPTNRGDMLELLAEVSCIKLSVTQLKGRIEQRQVREALDMAAMTEQLSLQAHTLSSQQMTLESHEATIEILRTLLATQDELGQPTASPQSAELVTPQAGIKQGQQTAPQSSELATAQARDNPTNENADIPDSARARFAKWRGDNEVPDEALPDK